jgi:hypothetical protein
MERLDELELLRAQGEGWSTWSLEVSLLSDELEWLRRLLETLIAESEERSAASTIERALRALRGERFRL